MTLLYSPVPLRMSRNFCITDIYLENPPSGVASIAYEETGRTNFLSSFNGLGAVSKDIRDLLPPECEKAFGEALQHEVAWQSHWSQESDKMSRRQPVIDKAIVPYSMSS